ncbi:ATP-binding protein [Alloacidobacterium dinghuense]|uniref:ATP-binding protein n=1 Tax=Alloacidobacterium dinghuense TaxID=2763107 RepID=A0A7G8BQ49_9BACT|nr:ATP-binding protein [Alloacidobacterium dinghuense]QNI34669.1 ATP-binding protein [Alloacidobacterium dinghuense]
MTIGLPSNPQPRKALLVGTDALVTNTVSTVLSAWTLIRVNDSEAALSLLKKDCVDLVVTGEQSHANEDIGLLRKIRRAWPHTRMIILTDESTPADAIAAIRFHAFSYFSKPYTQQALSDMLRLASEAPAWDDGIDLISATPEWIVLTARCDLGTAERLFQFAHEVADLPESEQERVGLAFREMLLNAMEHGGHFDPSKHVEISYTRARHVVMCRIKDPGEGFSKGENPYAASSNPPDDPFRHLKFRQADGVRPGGYGMVMAKQMVDEVIYGEKGNDVLLIKYLDMTATENSSGTN